MEGGGDEDGRKWTVFGGKKNDNRVRKGLLLTRQLTTPIHFRGEVNLSESGPHDITLY